MSSLSDFDSSFNKSTNSKIPCPYSERELEVLNLICHFYNSKEISELLSISRGTVKRHIENMRNKTGSRSLLELAIGAIENKWIYI